MQPFDFTELVPAVYICKMENGTVGFREGCNSREIYRTYPDVQEAYRLTESQEREVEAAWRGYWDHSQDWSQEPRARRLLAAIINNIFKRAKEANNE